MFQAICKMTLPALSVVLLSGCTGGYNPQVSSLSTTDTCVTLQRKMLFLNSNDVNNTNDNQWSNQVTQQQLQQDFHDLNCYQVLSDARAGQAQK